jgi:hypothetical protein
LNQSDLQSQIDADGDVHGGGIGTISFVSCGNKEAIEAAEQQTISTDFGKDEGELEKTFCVGVITIRITFFSNQNISCVVYFYCIFLLLLLFKCSSSCTSWVTL